MCYFVNLLGDWDKIGTFLFQGFFNCFFATIQK